MTEKKLGGNHRSTKITKEQTKGSNSDKMDK